MIKGRYLAIQIFLCLCFSLTGQELKIDKSKNGFFSKYHLDYNISQGFLLSHHPIMRPMVTDHFSMNELCISRKPDFSKGWQRNFNGPRVGISLFYSNLQSPILGNAFALFPSIDFPLIRNSNRLSLQSGIGLGYLTEKYDMENNFQNIAIGSHLNATISLKLKFRLRVTDNILLYTGPGLIHFSNGSTRFPNLGINLAHWHLGFDLSKNNTIKRSPEISLEQDEGFSREKKLRTSLTGGVRQIVPIGSDLHYSINLNSIVFTKASRKLFYLYGIDLFYNTSIRARKLRDSANRIKNIENLKGGLSGGIALEMGELLFSTQMGFYFLDKHNLDGNIYHRLGFLYDINEKFGANLCLITHFAKADHIEFGIAYNLDL